MLKKLVLLLAVIFMVSGCTKVEAAGREVELLVDENNVLETEEKEEISLELEKIMNDDVVCIIRFISLKENDEFEKLSDQAIDETDYLQGISLLIDVEKHQFYIGTKGVEIISIFNDSVLDTIINDMLPSLKESKYKKASLKFIEDVNKFYLESTVSEDIAETE